MIDCCDVSDAANSQNELLCRIITLQLHAEDLEVERPPIQLRIKKIHRRNMNEIEVIVICDVELE